MSINSTYIGPFVRAGHEPTAEGGGAKSALGGDCGAWNLGFRGLQRVWAEGSQLSVGFVVPES